MSSLAKKTGGREALVTKCIIKMNVALLPTHFPFPPFLKLMVFENIHSSEYYKFKIVSNEFFDPEILVSPEGSLKTAINSHFPWSCCEQRIKN